MQRSTARPRTTVRTLGGIDILVANAGVATFGTRATTCADALVRAIERRRRKVYVPRSSFGAHSAETTGIAKAPV